VSHQVNRNTPGEDLWEQRVDALGLQVETSPVWAQVELLFSELAAKGLSFRPRFYVANEWGCPDGQPIIGIPFYLVDPRFHPFEEQYADDLEDDTRVLAGLRHEVGHAINYAYALHRDPEWKQLFGAFDKPYGDDYLPNPFCKNHVRHLPGWYAQKHPDEDFAETFAVWLTPGLDWRVRYAAWDVLPKLEYIDRIMKLVADATPVVDPSGATTDPNELAFTVADFYKLRAAADSAPVTQLEGLVEEDLKEIFPASGVGSDASSVLWDRRKVIMRQVSNYTGARLYVVKSILDHVAQKLRVLNLRVAPGTGKESESLIGLTAMISALTMNFLRQGHFSCKPTP
jgi:hypothetical protein